MKSLQFTPKIKNMVLVFAGLLLSLGAHSQTIKFSGNWRVNRDQTAFGVFGEASIPIELNVTQTRDSLIIKRTSKGKDGSIHSYTERLSFNGNAIESDIRSTIKKAIIKWAEDKQSLIESADYHNEQFSISYHASETWTLSTDGRTLTISRIDDGDDGHSESKAVYDKN